ncbi:MAG: hypothetical protein WC505_01355 [Patescibacteria group bacterium]
MPELAITRRDRTRYVLKTKRDEEILLACKGQEQKQLPPSIRRQIRFIKSQLRDNWRTPLEKELKQIARLYCKEK